MQNHFFKFTYLLAMPIFFACGSSNENVTFENMADQALEKQDKAIGDFDACSGMDESAFREIFEVPESYALIDVSMINISKSTCVMVGDDSGKKLGVMVQLMSTPATYSVIAAGMKRDFNNAPESNRISGLGEAAVWTERENRKVSGITVVGDDHVVAILFDHYNTRSREQLQPMLEAYYNHWVKSLK
ncbi:hypothetical protein [Algoriphagus litoralis]|uniref:hypothetical protein n=1 Tax=Algoriphagus litoralis TaxID=2202829 RepID=UPI000DBA8540|nr:hypothetical protein [Algoriphagus litoralis]